MKTTSESERKDRLLICSLLRQHGKLNFNELANFSEITAKKLWTNHITHLIAYEKIESKIVYQDDGQPLVYYSLIIEK